MSPNLTILISILLYSSAIFCLYLMLLNRYLILIPDSKFKGPIIYSGFILVACSGIGLGILFSNSPWLYAPIVLLGLIFIGEIRRLLIRQSSIGSPPVESSPHKIDLTQPMTTTDIAYHRYELHIPEWKGPKFRIAHLTDFHIQHNLPMEYYIQVLEMAKQMNPDLAFFTGDFITKTEDISLLQKIIYPIGRIGSYGVLGNHDYWADPNKVSSVVKEKGITLLTNETITVPIDGHEIMLTGYDYPWGTHHQAISPSENGTLHFVLSHTPDNIYRISKSKADGVFSGHYHGGQLRIPILGSVIIPSKYGRRFDEGHFIVNGTHLFIPSGIGAASPSFRIYCKPSIFIIDVST